MVVVGRADDIIGVATSSSEGAVSADDLATRPILRPGEIMETIPGVIVTQHSGSGKANQYFLRGFNLDHGTDLATDFEGMPINMPTHAHGQGYTDLNFIIPELVSEVDYKKGNYYAGVGDFGSAGAFSIHYFDALPGSFLKIEGGEIGDERLVFAMSTQVGPGHLLYAFEMEHNNGPWDHGDDYQKFNGIVRYSVGDGLNGASLTAIAYHGNWNSSDQVPVRAIDEKIIGRFGEIDPTDGGNSSRYGLNGEWHRGTENEQTHVVAYATDYALELFSDFTYFLGDPVHGDQFEQKDQRAQIGASASETWNWKLLGFDTQNTVGLQERTDFIHLGLYHTEDQVVLNATRVDHVIETRVGPYLENKTTWLPWLRTVAGFRADVYSYHDTDYTDHLSGNGTAAIVSPKFSLILGPWDKTEFYLNGGYGFHSNDIRGVVGPPIVGNDAPKGSVNPLVKSKGGRGRRAQHLRARPAKLAHALDSWPGQRTGLRRRCRRQRTQPPQSALGRGVGQLLHAHALADARPGFRVFQRPLYRPRSGGTLGARSHRDHTGRWHRGPRSGQNVAARFLRRGTLPLFRPAHPDRRRQPEVFRHLTGVPAIRVQIQRNLGGDVRHLQPARLPGRRHRLLLRLPVAGRTRCRSG